MSRLIIKNLPNKVTEKKLRSLFSQKGEITDLQLKFTSDGKFRNFGFIGYKSEEQATKALKYFNNTCINTNRITVEYCAPIGDTNKPRAWSKYAKKKEKSIDLENKSEKLSKKEKRKQNKLKELLEKHKDDPLFEEYLQIHLSKGTWANDIDFQTFKENYKQLENNIDESQTTKCDEDSKEENIVKEKIANKEISDLDYMKSLISKKTKIEDKQQKSKKEKTPRQIKLYTVKITGLPFTCKKKDIKDFFKPLVPYSIRIPRKIKGFAYIGFKEERFLKKALLKDRSFLKGHRIFVVKYVKKENSNESENKDDNKNNSKWKKQEESLRNEEGIAETGQIFLRNLPYTTTEDEIQKLFEKYGPIAEVNVPVDKITRKIKGIATVSFVMPEHAVKAYCELDGSIFQGRMLHLLPAKTKNSEIDESQLSYKEKKMLKEKKESNSSHNWNTLFLGIDAVSRVMAQHYGTSRAKILGVDVDERSKTQENNKNPDDLSAAVRLALGETQIVEEIKKFLENNDVHLGAFNGEPQKRSKTIILAKNLPADTKKEEIVELFKPFGVLGRVVVPPNGLTALIEFFEPYEARNAFKKLAYSKFKHLPLYLEWAPDNSFKTQINKNSNETTSQNLNEIKDTESNLKNLIESNIPKENHDDNNKNKNEINVEEFDDEDLESNTTIFVKNINFSTNELNLKKHFEQCGKVYYATIASKKNPDNPNKALSLGYGFIRYCKQEDVEKALKQLNQSTLDGKSLELKRSERIMNSEIQNTKKTIKNPNKESTKILVRNVPFQTTQQELLNLFKTFGEIKALRLPKKMSIGDSGHRGFAFVDFLSKNDAKRAFESLSQSTHLYGRRLVLEWAENESENVDILRKRTAEKFGDSDQLKFKRNKSIFSARKIFNKENDERDDD